MRTKQQNKSHEVFNVTFTNGDIWLYLQGNIKTKITKNEAEELIEELKKAISLCQERAKQLRSRNNTKSRQKRRKNENSIKKKKSKKPAFMLSGRNSIYVIGKPPPKSKPNSGKIPPSKPKTILRRKTSKATDNQNPFNPLLKQKIKFD